MQAEYPRKVNPTYWDRVHIKPRVSKFPDTGYSAETISHKYRPPPELEQELKPAVPEVTFYERDYTVTNQLTRSQTYLDFGYKAPDTQRFNKHTAWAENEYIYPLSRRFTDQPPKCNAHDTTEMQRAYKIPRLPPTVATEKNQYKRPVCVSPESATWVKNLEPLDTTQEGFEKYLDPYLTTNRLYHRPYTADQLSKRSVAKDIITYHTFSKEPWVRTRKPPLDVSPTLERRKITYDRESIRKNSSFSLPKEQEFREIITHNKPKWLPSSFRTEVRDNYILPSSQAGSYVNNLDTLVASYYQNMQADMPTNEYQEHLTAKQKFASEASHIGSGKAICSVLDQFKERNRRLLKS